MAFGLHQRCLLLLLCASMAGLTLDNLASSVWVPGTCHCPEAEAASNHVWRTMLTVTEEVALEYASRCVADFARKVTPEGSKQQKKAPQMDEKKHLDLVMACCVWVHTFPQVQAHFGETKATKLKEYWRQGCAAHPPWAAGAGWKLMANNLGLSSKRPLMWQIASWENQTGHFARHGKQLSIRQGRTQILRFYSGSRSCSSFREYDNQTASHQQGPI